MHPSQVDFLYHILDEATYCINKTADMQFENFIADETITRAVIRSLEVIGEASRHIHPDLKTKYSFVEWKEMAGMRDRLIHHYFGIDYEIFGILSKIKSLNFFSR